MIVAPNPRQRHRSGLLASQSRLASQFKFYQPICLVTVTKAGRKQPPVDRRASNCEPDDARNQHHECSNPKKGMWVGQSVSSTLSPVALALRAVAKAPRRPKSLQAILSNSRFGGEGEIRTHEPRKGPPVFKTGAFNRSATSPMIYINNLRRLPKTVN